MPTYRQSTVQQIVTLAPPISTTTTLEVRGADDGYAVDRRDFTTDESIRVNGTVTAAIGGSLMGAPVEIYVDGSRVGTVSLGSGNAYVFSIGVISAEGQHTIRVEFPRYRTLAASMVEASINMPLLVVDYTSVLIGASIVAGIAILLWYVAKKRY